MGKPRRDMVAAHFFIVSRHNVTVSGHNNINNNIVSSWTQCITSRHSVLCPDTGRLCPDRRKKVSSYHVPSGLPYFHLSCKSESSVNLLVLAVQL